MKTAAVLAMCASIAVGCHAGPSSLPAPVPAATPAPVPGDIMIRTRVVAGDSFVPQTGDAALRAFVPEVAADETGGECVLLRTGGSGATMVTAYYPRRVDARLQVTVTFDSSGRVARYSERRGVAHPVTRAGMSAATLDSALRAAEASVRSTTVSMDYPIDQALAINRGGGKPTMAVMGTVRTMESLASLGPPAARLERMRKLCGV